MADCGGQGGGDWEDACAASFSVNCERPTVGGFGEVTAVKRGDFAAP